ncbi:hypothetical protein ACQKL5_05435 [Peribacillus sp. NPDC097675]|uniref:hypothetical protein n=1 Tax=Peribacillus sp. NPDC097675 TaxID=3390618 RepID=UPI003CFC89BE
MKRLSLFALCLVSLTFASGCADKEEEISIQKRIGEETYRYEAYKENIKMKRTEKPKEILGNAEWKENPMKEDDPKADFIFYFNDRNLGDRIPVYYVWVNAGKSTLEVTKDEQDKYVQLSKEDSAVILDLLQ